MIKSAKKTTEKNLHVNLSEAIQFTKANREAWREGKGAQTAAINARHVERILGGDLSIYDIETKHFTQLTQQLQAEGKAKATINRITTALSTVINELRQHGYKIEQPAYKRQRESQGRPEFYTEAEVDQLLAVAWHRRDYLLLHDSILFAIKTGCRQHEMLSLNFADINWEDQTVTFRDVKTGGDHTIKLHDELIPVLKRRAEVSIGAEVFQWRDKDQLLDALRQVQEECNIPKEKCWHTFRHTTATWLLERNVPVRAVMGVLNHSRIETTLRYGKYTDRSIAAAIDRI